MTENEAIEEFKENIELPFGSSISNESSEMAISALEEIQQYRALGTVKELRKATEKQRAKKPKEKIELLADISFGIAPCRSYYCQKCGGIIKEWSAKYCSVCGQAIDWSAEE